MHVTLNTEQNRKKIQKNRKRKILSSMCVVLSISHALELFWSDRCTELCSQPSRAIDFISGELRCATQTGKQSATMRNDSHAPPVYHWCCWCCWWCLVHSAGSCWLSPEQQQINDLWIIEWRFFFFFAVAHRFLKTNQKTNKQQIFSILLLNNKTMNITNAQ